MISGRSWSAGWFFDTEIVVLPSPEEFIFRRATDEVRVAPVVWLDAAGERLLAIGDGQVGRPPLRRVEVFRPQPADPEVPRTRLLTMVLRYGLKELSPKGVFSVKPIVRFGSLAAFDQLLSGFQHEIFKHCALEAGARKVRFDPPAPSLRR